MGEQGSFLRFIFLTLSQFRGSDYLVACVQTCPLPQKKLVSSPDFFF